jgi:hypothetical protein
MEALFNPDYKPGTDLERQHGSYHDEVDEGVDGGIDDTIPRVKATQS